MLILGNNYDDLWVRGLNIIYVFAAIDDYTHKVRTMECNISSLNKHKHEPRTVLIRFITKINVQQLINESHDSNTAVTSHNHKTALLQSVPEVICSPY